MTPGVEMAIRPSGAPAADRPLVDVDNLTVRFVSRDLDITVVNGISFTVNRGEVLCLLGESGSGKTVTMLSLMRLLAPTARITGRVMIDDIDVLRLPAKRLREVRGSLVSMIFQEPMVALDPTFTIGQQISETIVFHEGASKSAAMKRARELLDLVQVPSAQRRLAAYPHELSGGLRQRAMIALALACRPKLLLADEPTTALDATVQIQILLLLRELQREFDMATIFVTHDLGVTCEIADRVAVMYAGRIVETGLIDDVMNTPRHPYTEGLLRSTVHSGLRGRQLDTIPGSPPNLADLPPGCAFAPRCGYVRDICRARVPVLAPAGQAQFASCLRYRPDGSLDPAW